MNRLPSGAKRKVGDPGERSAVWGRERKKEGELVQILVSRSDWLDRRLLTALSPYCAPLTRLAKFSFRPIPRLGACSQANSVLQDKQLRFSHARVDTREEREKRKRQTSYEGKNFSPIYVNNTCLIEPALTK